MHALLQTRFFQSLMTTVSMTVLPFDDLCILFDEFVRIVIDRCNRDDLQSTLRMLSYTHARLDFLPWNSKLSTISFVIQSTLFQMCLRFPLLCFGRDNIMRSTCQKYYADLIG